MSLFTRVWILSAVRIYVKDYADVKFGCVPVAQPKTCHYRPRELPGRGTKGQAMGCATETPRIFWPA